MPDEFDSPRAPEPVGLYPHARRVGNLLFLSGVGPRERGTKQIPGVELNDAGVKKPAAPRPKVKKVLAVPDYFTAALKKNKKASATFEGFSYSHKKEYVEWITEAKQEATRARRLQTTLEWLAEGKSRNWKYANC